MTETSRSSMAAALSVFMTVLMWLFAIFGGVAFLICGFGYMTSVSGGEVTTPMLSAVVDGPSANALLLAMVILIAIIPASIYICFQLRRILETLAMGDPFVPDNASRLKRIAFAVAIMEFLRYVAILVGSVLSAADKTLDGPSPLPAFATWVAVVALFVLAQVFKEGARLRAEEKMTI